MPKLLKIFFFKLSCRPDSIPDDPLNSRAKILK
jgi:hypothetical protein